MFGITVKALALPKAWQLLLLGAKGEKNGFEDMNLQYEQAMMPPSAPW